MEAISSENDMRHPDAFLRHLCHRLGRAPRTFKANSIQATLEHRGDLAQNSRQLRPRVGIEALVEPGEMTLWAIVGGVVTALGFGAFIGWYFQEILQRLVPPPLSISRWLRTRDIVPSEGTHFTILIADLDGDDDRLSQTKHVEAALLDQQGLEVVLVGPGPGPFKRGSRTDHQIRAQRQGRELLARHNGDLLIWGEVAKANTRVRLCFLARTEGAEGKQRTYQIEAAELPRDFGENFNTQLVAVALASLALATEQQGRYLVHLLKQPAGKLERLLEKGAPGLDPDQMAGLQFALGNAASAIEEQSGDSKWLQKAVVAYRNALKEWTRERAPFDWATTQNNLGVALLRLGHREVGTEGLQSAVAAFERAAEEWTRESVPLRWAGVQNNLGLAFTTIGQRRRDIGSLQRAIVAYRLALEEWTRERVPMDRAIAQSNLGLALTTKGELEGDRHSLQLAIDACEEARELGSRESAPLLWARCQNNLAYAMVLLGRSSGDRGNPEILNKALNACHGALEILSREETPEQWAHTQDTLGFALVALGECEKDVLKLEEGIRAYRAALDAYLTVGAEFDIEDSKASLARAETELARRRGSGVGQ